MCTWAGSRYLRAAHTPNGAYSYASRWDGYWVRDPHNWVPLEWESPQHVVDVAQEALEFNHGVLVL